MGMNSMRVCICLILCACCCSAVAASSVAPSDVEALQAFASGIRKDPVGVLESWATADEEACSWEGVECTWIYDSQAYRVVGLRLPGFLLEGTISPRLGQLSELRALDLSENRLSGHIPAELAALPQLQDVDFSSNRLSGSIPPGKSFKKAGFLGNSQLCGRPLDRECPSRFSLLADFFSHLISASAKKRRSSMLPSWQSALSSRPQSLMSRRSLLDGAPAPAPAPQSSRTAAAAPGPSISAKPHKRSKLKRWGIGAALGIAAGSLGGILLGSIGRVAFIIYKNSRKKEGPIIFHPKITPKMLTFLNSADSFHQMDVLGAGGAGKVYKGTLENGLVVAIKRIPIQQPPADTGGSGDSNKVPSFGKRHTVAEMETLGKIRHNNLAWLYAYVRKPDAHLLLYQFMAQGSLQDVMARVREGALDLDWKARQRIAIGIATGLKYLHFDCTPKILHRDLKTSNILLDENLKAHLGDFGLAKALPDEMTHVTTGVAGTIGYIAPEYNQTMKFTTSSDIYSFGIILGILLVGKEPTDDFFSNFGGIVSFMCSLVQTGQELKGLDPTLIRAPPEENMATPGSDAGAPLLSSTTFTQPNEIAEMKLALRIACLCTKTNPGDRPSGKDLLVMLHPGKLATTVRPMDELINE